MKYREWLNWWYDNCVVPQLKEKTCNRYFEIMSNNIIPTFGEYRIDEINGFMMQSYIAYLLKRGNIKTGEGLSSNSVNMIINVLKGSLKTAYNYGYLKEDISIKIKRPKQQGKDISCFSIVEQRIIEEEIRKIKKDKYFGIILCLYSGLRIGELLALEWSDINFEQEFITVNKTCFDGRDKDGVYRRVVNAPKTASSKRIIPLPKQIVCSLEMIKGESSSNYVISNREKPISIRSYQRSFETLLKKNNIEKKGFHTLRHTFATRALECGMDVKTLSEILGHNSPTITLNRYVHSLMDHKREMMNKVSEFININISKI